MGTAINSPPVMAQETKHLAGSELAGWKVGKNSGDSQPRLTMLLILLAFWDAACDSPRFFHALLYPIFRDLHFYHGLLLMFSKYSVGAQRAAPALARHLLCPKTTLYSAGINRSSIS